MIIDLKDNFPTGEAKLNEYHKTVKYFCGPVQESTKVN